MLLKSVCTDMFTFFHSRHLIKPLFWDEVSCIKTSGCFCGNYSFKLLFKGLTLNQDIIGRFRSGTFSVVTCKLKKSELKLLHVAALVEWGPIISFFSQLYINLYTLQMQKRAGVKTTNTVCWGSLDEHLRL